MDKLERMNYLIGEIEKHNINYYVYDNPTISDYEYDKLYYELVDLEKELNLTLPNSPTNRVGDAVLDKFKKHKHEVRLFSLSKVRSFEDLDKWTKDMREFLQDANFSLEYKFDGLNLVIEYNNGEFVSATTRGNGLIGEDVSLQVKTIKSVPLKINFKGRLIVQGEGMMTQKAFKKYNETASEPLKNPRNGVAGAIRNLDPKVTAKRNLDFFCYSILLCDGKIFESQQEIINFLKENNFKTGNYFKVLSTIDELKNEIQKVDKEKSNLDVMIDGMVIKVNQVKVRDEIGYTNKFPKWAMAYKFEAEEITTILNDVIWQVGRSGKVTPIAVLEPVELAGATVKRATLNNYDDIKKKNVSIGSRIFIRRSNEVIPEVLGLAEKYEHSKEIEVPSFCPCCSSLLVQKGPLLFCENSDNCKEQVVDKIVHFASRDAFNIEGLSEKTIELFFDNFNLRKFSDLFKYTSEDFMKLEKFKEKKSNNLENAINNSKKIEFNRFLYALGISEVGIKTAKDIAKTFASLDELKNASVESINSIKDIGEIIANNIFDYFKNEENNKEIENLFGLGVEIIYPNINKNGDKFSGKKFVLTGTLTKYTRNQATEIIESLGGETSSSVSKNIDYVLAGENAGSKLDKARSLNIKIISEQEFEDMIN